MRRRYLSLVAAPGLTEAHLLIYENEAKWASSNPPNSSPSTTPSPNRTSPQLLSPAPLQTIEQFLQADDGSRKGAKYLVRLEGLFYAGINHVGVNGRLSVTAVIKSALGKLVVGSSKSQDLTSSGRHHHQQQKETKKKDAQQQRKSGALSSEVAGSAESYISTTSTPGTLKNSTEMSMMSSQRPASICGIPSLDSTPISPNSPNSVNPNSPRSPVSLGLYFQDGSSTLMSFATPDIMEAWLQVLTAVVATNRSRSGYPNIEYASTVTCRFKPKEFNSGPFPKIKGECLFCLSKLDVLLITQNVKQPDLSIRFPYVRNCASRDDGRLCFDVGRAAPTGECELILQMPNAKEAKAAHTRCITLMRQCTTWLKLGRDGPSSRRKTLPNFGKKTTGVNLAGPPLPQVPGTASAPVSASAAPGTAAVATPPMSEQQSPHTCDSPSTSDHRLSFTAVAASNHLPILPESSVVPFPPPPAPPLIPPLPDLTTLALSSHSASHLIGRRFHPHFSSSLSKKSHSFPSRFSTEPIPEVVVLEEEMAASGQSESAYQSPNKLTDESLDTEDSPPTPTRNSNTDSITAAADPVNHYLQLNVDNLVGTHIKSIAKYTAGDSLDGSGKGGKGGDDRLGNLQSEIPSEETIHHVLAYLSSITRPSKVAGIGECETPRSGTVSSVSRQPTVKFSPNTLMIPADQGRDGVYVDSLIFGIDRLTTKVGSQSSEISRTSSIKKMSTSSGTVQLRRPKRGFSGYTSQSGNNLGISSGGSGGSMSSNNRSRIYSHRDNDELFADLTYGPAGSSRHTMLCQMSKGSICDRSSVSFEAGHMSMVEESCCSYENDKDRKRPRTASDTGTKWKTSITAPIRFLPSTTQIADAVSRPRARSLTHQLATKPLSQPIGMKDLESMPSGEVYNGVVQLGSRSSSTTSTSKNIRRALEHVLGRPRSTEEGNGLIACVTSPSHHYNSNNNSNNNSNSGNGNAKSNSGQNKGRLHDSDIYVELDFPPPNQSTQTIGNELSSEMRNALRGSLLVTPSDSLSSNSSCLSFYGGGGSVNSGRQSLPTARNVNGSGGMSFTEHYGFVFGQGAPMSTGRTPFLIKPTGANVATASPNTAACDISPPTSAH
ncbi:unnamed protein product [Hymenolepis diminuta]|nr:unnamed protein product [Hymenolepis diminuta]